MATALKSRHPEQSIAGDLMDSANQIWLASLGAFAKTQEGGSQFIETFIRMSEKMEARARKAVNAQVQFMQGKVEKVKHQASQKLNKLEQVFQDRVTWALNRLGIPTNEDVKGIMKRLEKLDANIKEYSRVH